MQQQLYLTPLQPKALATSLDLWGWQMNPKATAADNLADALHFHRRYRGGEIDLVYLRAEVAAKLPADTPVPVQVDDRVTVGAMFFRVSR